MNIPQPAEIWVIKQADWADHHLIVSLRGAYQYYSTEKTQYDYDTINLESGEPDVIYFRLGEGWERV
jgi:hypothetical protein